MYSPVARKNEEGGMLVKGLGDDEARPLVAAAANAVLLAAQANAAARGKPNSIHAETDNSTSNRWKESGRQTTLPAGMPWSHEGWLKREEGGRREEERCWEAGAKGKDEDSYVVGRLVRLRSVESGPVLYVGACFVWVRGELR